MGSGLGFGLERIGLAVVARPLLWTVILLASLIGSATTISGLRFNGTVVDMVDANSQAYRDFERHKQAFRDFGNDVAIVVRDPLLLTAEGLESLRELHLDLALADNVLQVFSIFSIGGFPSGAAEFEPYLPESFADDDDAARAVARLLEDAPSAHGLVSPQENAAMVVVTLDFDDDISEDALRGELQSLRSAIAEDAPAGWDISLAGLPPVRTAVVSGIINDQTKLTLIGILMGALVGFGIFGSIRSALICTLPGGISVLWVLGLFSLAGQQLNFLTTVLPSLALIIAFADGIVLFFRWQALNAEQEDQIANLRQAIRQVGPASALTSITTALAFGSFAYASSATMKSFAWFGVAAVALAFLAVMIGLPVICYWSARLGGARTRARPRFSALGERLARLPRGRPPVTAAVSIVLLCLLSVGHVLLQPSYEATRVLPSDSEVRRAETFANDVFGGTSHIFLMMPVSAGGDFADAENRERVTRAHEALAGLLGAERVVSLGGIWNRIEPGQVDTVAGIVRDLDPSLKGRFLSEDNRTMLIAVTSSSGDDTSEDAKAVEEMRRVLQQVGPTDDLVFTGIKVLMARQFPVLIDQLRTGLLIAVFLAVGIVMLAARSFRLGLAALVPNLLPILFTEAIILVSGSLLDITNVIALTIAFGIAIDNAVHILNSYTADRRKGADGATAIDSAVREIGPALVASTTILSVATLITQFSSLPSVAVLGRLLIVTLIVALGTNLVILPAFIRLLSGEKNETDP